VKPERFFKTVVKAEGKGLKQGHATGDSRFGKI
jgi:hypothetical protein